MSTSAALITAVGSWRLAYLIQAGALGVQTIAWLIVAREDKAPLPSVPQAMQEQQASPIRALRLYPQGWFIGVVMFGLSATWTALVTFLPTLLLDSRGMAPTFSGPLLGFLYYGLIPGGLLAGMLAKRVQNRQLFLWLPALCNLLLGLAITYTTTPWLLMVLLTGVGLVWIASPIMEILPFELPDIQPRQVAVIVSLVRTLSGLGFAIGPLVTGMVAQWTGSLQTGLLALCLLTGVGVIAGLCYPSPASTRHDGAAGADLG
jgi:cyanate permease